MKIKPQKLRVLVIVAGLALSCPTFPTVGDEREKVDKVKLNIDALEYAKKLIDEGEVVVDGRGAWAQHQPSSEEENEFVRRHGFGEYAKWHLGVDERHPENTKARYKFPYGDFRNIHRCALLAARSRARQHRHYDIEKAAIELSEMMRARRCARLKTLVEIDLTARSAIYFDVQAVRKASINSGKSSL